MKETPIVLMIIAVNVALLFFGASTLSISFYEADIFYNSNTTAHYLARFFCSLLGQNDYALRLPFILLHACSAFLLYVISKSFLKRETDRIISVLIYVMLPGTISAALLVNSAGIVIFGALLVTLFYQKEQRVALYVALLVTLFLDDGFIVLYFLLFFYAVYKKDTHVMCLTLALFTASAYIYGIPIGNGKPRGHFLDTLGIYAAVFSPLLFLYFIYAEYRMFVKGGRNILWWLSFGIFLVSILLSFRQRVSVETFAVYLIISTPLLVGTFFNSYRVRLPKYRKLHKIFAFIVVSSLVLSSAAVLANPALYYFVKDPENHFAYKYHVAKEVAAILKEKGITNINADDEKLASRLKFYGINEGGNLTLARSVTGSIPIKCANKNIATFEIIDTNAMSD